MKKLILLGITTIVLNIAKAQDDRSIDRLYDMFIENYIQVGNIYNWNYYQILTQAGKLTFTFENTAFQDAVTFTKNKSKISEAAAIDTLFNRTLTRLRLKDIWLPYKEQYRSGEQLLDLYNSYLCKCISSNITKDEPGEKFLEIQKNCIATTVQDSIFIRKLREIGGKFTINDLAKYQVPLVAKLYAECPIVTYRLNLGLHYSIVEETYRSDIYNKRQADINSFIENFKSQKLELVKNIFPGYIKFKKEINSLVTLLNESKTKIYYSDFTQITTIEITDKSGNITLGKFKMADKTYVSRILSLELKTFNDEATDQIIELKEDSVQTQKIN